MEQIAVIGIGRLGLCLALNLEKSGYAVLGVDVDKEYVNALNHKTFNSPEPGVNEYLSGSVNFKATTQVGEILNDALSLIFIVVPTPSLPDGGFSHTYIDAVITELSKYGKQSAQKHVIINSTCMPGYCDSVKEKLSRLNYTVTYNPEFIAQGSIIRDQQYPDQILIGENDPATGDLLQAVYKKLCKNNPVYCRMSPISAEITKLATNCFLTTKISFANAIGDIATQVGAEPEKVLQAIGADSRIGEKYFRYGFGYGGPCFPRDNKAFLRFSESAGYKMLIAETTDKANEQHADFLQGQWEQKFTKDNEIIFDSVTYKKGTDIIEESQQLKLAVSLAKAGYNITVKESPDVIRQLMNHYADLFTYKVNEP